VLEIRVLGRPRDLHGLSHSRHRTAPWREPPGCVATPVVPALRQWPKQGDRDQNDERLDQDRDIGAPGVLQTRSGELTSVERDVCDPVPSNGAEQRSSRPEHPSSPTSHPSRACQSSQLRAMAG
jgi:hypothetical protein